MRLVILLLVLLAASLSACGGGSKGSGGDSTNVGSGGRDATEIATVTKQMFADIANKDWAGVCSRLSARAQAKFTKQLGKHSTCAAAWKAVAANDPGIKQLHGRQVEVVSIKVKGNTATAKVTPTLEGTNPTFEYLRADGAWKIDISS